MSLFIPTELGMHPSLEEPEFVRNFVALLRIIGRPHARQFLQALARRVMHGLELRPMLGKDLARPPFEARIKWRLRFHDRNLSTILDTTPAVCCSPRCA